MVEKYREALRRHRIVDICAIMVLLAMVEFGLDYDVAIAEVAAFYGEAKERQHSAMCYTLLAAGIEKQPRKFFDKLCDDIWEDELLENGSDVE
jgi:hypothetical protein